MKPAVIIGEGYPKIGETLVVMVRGTSKVGESQRQNAG